MHLGFSTSPAPVLEALYQKVYQEEMQGLPICNEKIKVEAVDFQLYQDQWLGVLVTPWFTNLLIIRQQGQDWPEFKLAKGNEQLFTFPVGEIKFTPRFEPELGSYLCCSLVSPMAELGSHQQAIIDAKHAMRQLTQIPIDIKIIDTKESDATADKESLNEEQQSRRSFFRGKRQVAL